MFGSPGSPVSFPMQVISRRGLAVPFAEVGTRVVHRRRPDAVPSDVVELDVPVPVVVDTVVAALVDHAERVDAGPAMIRST